MAESATDVLTTLLQVQGFGQWSAAFNSAERVLGSFKFKLDEAAAAQAVLAAGAAAAAGLILGGLFKATEAAASEQEVYNRAAGNFKGAFPSAEVASFSAQMQKLTGVADDQVGAFIGLLGTFQITKNQAQELALPILNAAEALKAQGVSTEQLAVQLGKAFQTGEPTALKRVGIILDETAFKSADAEGRIKLLMAALQAQGGDAALNFRNSFGGAMQAARSSLGDVAEAIGGPFVQGLTGAANAVESIARGIAGLPVPVLQAVGDAAVIAAIALGGVAITLAVSVTKAGLMAGTNADLARSAYSAAIALKAEADAATAVGGALQGANTKAVVAKSGGKGGLLASGAAFLAALGLDLGGQALKDASNKGHGPLAAAGSAFGHIGQRAGAGAGFGAFLGPEGALVGGILGGIEGSIETAFGGRGATGLGKGKTAEDPAVTQLRKTNELLQKQLDAFRATGGGFADSHLAPIAIQRSLTRRFAKQARV